VVSEGAQFGLGTYFLKFSREYEKQADLLGAQMMARAGYDPRALGQMFQTIERQSGSRTPQWMSDHPNPGNRTTYINQEASRLQIAPRQSDQREFAETQAALRSMPAAPTTEEIARGARLRPDTRRTTRATCFESAFPTTGGSFQQAIP
jgi:predicted Zn-dependent protease